MSLVMDTDMILVTGHRGFVGSRLFKKIQAVGVDLKTGFNLLETPLYPADTIYHLAAHTSVEESWEYPTRYSDNFKMTVRLIEEYPDSRIIFAQSAAAVEASSPYGFSKWASGEYLKKFHKNYVICTFPNVYGGGKGVVDIFKKQSKVTIYGDGLQVRDFVHVDDIVEGLLKAQNWPVGEYSLGSGKGTTILELAKDKEIIWAPARKEIRESILPNTTPDWAPTHDVLE